MRPAKLPLWIEDAIESGSFAAALHSASEAEFALVGAGIPSLLDLSSVFVKLLMILRRCDLAHEAGT